MHTKAYPLALADPELPKTEVRPPAPGSQRYMDVQPQPVSEGSLPADPSKKTVPTTML
jgi:hypothetical protein